jgi:RimJ/RimL family protein N-acetyltransferase
MGKRLADRVEGDGLSLVRWMPDDVDVLAELIGRNLDHLRPRMSWVAHEPLSRAARRAKIEEWDRDWRVGGAAIYAIVVDGHRVGGCGLHHRVGPGGLEIGYWVSADHVGRGVATRTAAALTDAAFSVDDVAFVVILHDQTNLASRRVPEKLGYHQVEVRPSDRELAPADTGIDVVWKVTRDEWLCRERSDEAPDA